MKYQEKLQQDRRFLILKVLSSAAAYRAGAPLLLAFLESMGHTCTRDQLIGELAWLKEQGLVELQNNDVATITQRGAEVAEDRAHHPGVRRPAPGEFDG